jgi:creatinine amidohydrolase/Fe(II)-dependent formamide hydrolase-like protein
MMLAEVGSIDGSLATIDLKNASDLISMLLIKLLWPSEWFHLFMDIRSPYTKIVDETNEKSHWIELNMMSTMGNGFTFPMMTLTLLALVYAVQSRRESRRLFVDFSETAVFGDDIIVRTEDYEPLVQTLSDAGLTVNLG